LLRERAAPIAATLTAEQGKPLAEAMREVTLAADIIDFLAEEAKRLASRGVPPRSPGVVSQSVERVPVGPVAAFTPWNFPANLPARKLGGAEVWIGTNDQNGSGGSTTVTSSGAPTATKLTDGTQRVFTEDLFSAGISAAWDQGGSPTLVLAGSFNKRKISTFTGNATKTIDMSEQELVAGVDVYISDFGRHRIVPSRFVRTRTVLGIDPEYWAVAVLQPMKTEPLAKIGHHERRMLSTELTLVCRNEKASFKVADLTTS